MIDAARPSHAPLDPRANPFSAASNAPPPLPSAETAFEQVIGHIRLGRRAVVIAGAPGTGKTSLLNRIVRACAELELPVCRFDRGDVADPAVGARAGVVLVDDADSIPDSAVLALLVPDPGDRPATWVFACRPSSVHRFGGLDAAIVELRGLLPDEARTYLLDRAASIGRPDLFAPAALDVITRQAGGSPRVLLSTASFAFFTAAWGGATRIGVRHVAYWLSAQASSDVAAGAPPPGERLRGERANRTEARHRSVYALDVSRPGRALAAEGRAVIARLRMRVSGTRARPLLGAAAIAASIGLAVAVSAVLLGGNDAGVETSASATAVPNPVGANASVVQPPAPPPAGPDSPAGAAAGTAGPPSADAPAAKAPAASGNRAPDRTRPPRATSKRAAPPAPVRTARLARPPQRASPPAAMQDAARHARDAVQVARQAEDAARRTAQAALQARQAARQASEASRRADRAARRADQAATRAERAARLADWRIQLPWNALPPPRRAS